MKLKTFLKNPFSYVACLIVLWLVFACVFYANSEKFSYSSPEKGIYARDFLTRFFSKVCIQGKVNSKAEAKENGCRYTYPNGGQVVESSGKVIYKVKNVEFSFESYRNGVLNLKYIIERDWLEEKNKIPIEKGLIILNLSYYENVEDKILLTLSPHISLDNYLLKKIEQQPDPIEYPNAFPTWGTLLVDELLALKSTGASGTIGREFPYFMVNPKTDSYIELKKYFDYGAIFAPTFPLFLYFSGITITSLGFGDIVPNSSFMRLLVVIEAICGVILLGIIAGAAFKYFEEK